jgi:hypothetical protein
MENKLEEVKAVVEWQHDGSTRWLTKPDPQQSFIRFTLQFNATCALFQIMIPIRYKDHSRNSAVYVHINPSSITSLKHSTQQDVPTAVKPVFSSATCLSLELNNTITVLVPSFIKEPVTAARLRSGKIIDSLCELLHTTSLHLYIPSDALSQHQLDSLCTAITQRQLQPFSGPDHDISCWFTGSGARVTTLARLPPPSYDNATTSAPLHNESATFDPPVISHKRKRSQEAVAASDAIWKKLLELEATIHHPPVIHQLRAENAELRNRLMRCEQKAVDAETENAELRNRLARCEQQVLDLETDVAGLQEAQGIADDAECIELSEIRDDIKILEIKIDFIERGKDDDELEHRVKERVLDELVARISHG